MRKYLSLIILFVSFNSYAVEKYLSTSGWVGYADGATSISVLTQNPLAAQVNAVGTDEGYPRLVIDIPGEDWRKYQKVAFDVLLESTAPCINDAGKDFVLVIQDQTYQLENTMGKSMAGQLVPVPHIKGSVSSWQSVEADIRGVSRKQIRTFIIYLYNKPFNFDHSYKVSFRNIRLIGNEPTSLFFDGTDFLSQSMPVGSGNSLFSVQTDDGLKLDITSKGAVSSVSVNGKEIGNGSNQASGIMVRDARQTTPPVMPEGTIERTADGIRQQASIPSLNLNLDATYKSAGNKILVSGKITSINNEDRSVTVYVSLPVSENTAWEFHKSLIHSTQPFADVFATPQLEDICTEYPVAVLANKSTDCGIGLIIDQMKPIKYRLAVNPKQKLLYAAFDIALLNQNRFDGTSQKSVDFQLEIVRTDASWGFRSGLEKLYNIHSECYTDNVGFGGGWELYTHSQFNYTNEQNIAGGYRFDWSAFDNTKTRWEQNVKNNFLNLLYTEPEYMQFSMGDFTSPTIAQTAQRFNNLIAQDADEWNTFMKLGYSQWYCGSIHAKSTALRPFTDNMLNSANASVVHDKDGNVVWNLGNRGWILDSNFGAMMPCNISPNIPDGRGSVSREIGLDPLYEEYITNGWTAPSGFALDEFMMSPDDYRRENFKYMETTLSFDPVTKQPMVIRGFSSVEWVKKLREDYAAKSRKLYLLANCKGPMTFAAPYLDIFGIENTYADNPDYFRVIAGKNKAITNVSYTPPPQKNLEYNLLWCIYTGRNATYDVLAPIVKMADKLYAAGWEPITAAIANPVSQTSDIRVERYGGIANDTIYYVVHNMGTNTVSINLQFDATKTGSRTSSQIVYNGDQTLTITPDNTVSFSIGNHETKVIMLARDKYAFEWNQEFDMTYGDTAVELTAVSENPGLIITYESANPDIAEIQNDSLKIKHAGVVNVTAIQQGTETIAESRITKSLSIKKKKIAVTAFSAYKFTGQNDPELTYTYPDGDLVGNDTFSGKLERIKGEDAGTYTINQGTLALSPDYLMNFRDGTFLISKDNVQSLTILDLILNNGVSLVVESLIKVDNFIAGGVPVEYLIGENDSFSGSQWQPYLSTFNYETSQDKGSKTLYFKVKDALGKESNTLSKSFYYTSSVYPEITIAVTNKLTIFPNPVQSLASLSLGNPDEVTKIKSIVKIMTPSGIMLDQLTVEESYFTYDFSHFSKGVLIVSVENQQNRYTGYVIKE